MQNGTGLLGDPSATQSSVVVPHPGEPDQYFIFTVPAREDLQFLNKGLFYSVVDLSQNGGLGAVILKNDSLCGPVSEKVTSVVHQNEKDVWVITHLWNSDAFYAYLIDGTGIQTTPVVSQVGSVHTDNLTNSAGYLKASVDGKKLALARQVITASTPPIQFPSVIEIFDFDNTSGIVFNPISTPSTYFRAYGLEFSPDSKKLYFGNNQPTASTAPFEIYQIDLEASDVIASTTRIGTHPKTVSSTFLGALQLGRDGRIYVAIVGNDSLGVIEQPNQLGTAANYKADGIYLGGRIARFGLPNFIYSAQALGEALARNVIHLKADQYTDKAQLSWRISRPQEISRFEIQKSKDGLDFQSIGYSVCLENQSQYSFIDSEYTKAQKLTYYRIHGVASDEKSLLNNGVVLRGDAATSLDAMLSPNPLSAQQILKIQFTEPIVDKVYLSLWDSRGRNIADRVVSPEEIQNSVFVWDLTSPVRGIYLLQIRSNQSNQILTKKLMVD
ncbi:MAG: T9SS type A sorting domain-containing protein [Microscillaceae bacterium]|nr:T9SS type A sorting domain-containing protein [Microscillaceae bacterium]